MKKYLLIIFILLFLFACKTKEAPVETTEPTIEPTVEPVNYKDVEDEELLELLDKYIAYVSRGPSFGVEILPPYQFEDFLDDFNSKNKYVIRFDDDCKQSILCGYVSLDIKNILDEHYEPEIHGYGYTLVQLYEEVYCGNGVNGYFKQYAHCAIYGCFDKETYNVKWVEYSDEKDIADVIDNMFLIYAANRVTINCEKYESRESFKISMYVEDIEYQLLKKYYKGIAFAILNHELNRKYILPYQYYELLYLHSLGIVFVDNKMYINTNHLSKEERMNDYSNNYILVDGGYCYSIYDIESVCYEK